jgi:hypothetical protein
MKNNFLVFFLNECYVVLFFDEKKAKKNLFWYLYVLYVQHAILYNARIQQ